MNHSIYVYILVMAGVTYLIRMLPLVLFKRDYKPVCKVLFVLCALCMSGGNDFSGNPHCAVFGNDRRGSRTWSRSDSSIPGKKPAYSSSLCLCGGVCGREDFGGYHVI